MRAKALEIRDIGTFIATLAVDMNPSGPMVGTQQYLLRRVGYPCDGRPNILITRLSGDGSKASNDPHYWGDRTMATAHAWIIEHWDDIADGDVIDVQWILGETLTKKKSERVSVANVSVTAQPEGRD